MTSFIKAAFFTFTVRSSRVAHSPVRKENCPSNIYHKDSAVVLLANCQILHFVLRCDSFVGMGIVLDQSVNDRKPHDHVGRAGQSVLFNINDQERTQSNLSRART